MMSLPSFKLGLTGSSNFSPVSNTAIGYFPDKLTFSSRRFNELSQKGFHFIPMGVSGGEEGARKGPSMMPGGDKMAYELIAPYLKKIAAKDASGKACVSYIGPGGSGHFIKMVHNSIEYAEMQVLAETVHLMKYGLKLSYPEISGILKSWGTEGLKSFLLDITVEILTVKEGKNFLLDLILVIVVLMAYINFDTNKS